MCSQIQLYDRLKMFRKRWRRLSKISCPYLFLRCQQVTPWMSRRLVHPYIFLNTTYEWIIDTSVVSHYVESFWGTDQWSFQANYSRCEQTRLSDHQSVVWFALTSNDRIYLKPGRLRPCQTLEAWHTRINDVKQSCLIIKTSESPP